MQLNFNNNDLITEQELVTSYFKRKAKHKSYPQDYLAKMMPLIKEMYSFFNFNPNLDILNDPEILHAYIFAREAHSGQKRKYINIDYIIHPLELASSLSNIKGITKDQIISALLHDVTEDCGISEELIHKKFGNTVKTYIHYLTDHAKPEDGNRAVRTEINFNHFKLSPDEVKNIKLLDLISNSRSIAICDANFSLTYYPVLKKMALYFENMSKENNNIVNESLVNQLHKIINTAEKMTELQKNYGIIKLDKKNTKTKSIENNIFEDCDYIIEVSNKKMGLR